MSAFLVLAGIVLLLASGIPPLAGRRAAIATPLLLLTGAAAGLAGSILGLFSEPATIAVRWYVPGGAFTLRVDALSAFFAIPVFLLAGAGGLYAERYWPATKKRGAWVRFFFGLMMGALALLMTAANTILFIVAWEVIGVAAFFLVSSDDEEEESRRAAWTYLVASHVATLSLFAAVAILHGLTHSWSFAALPAGTAALPAGRAIFWLAIVACGIKAGIMPFHVWLPGAHAASPSHVSAVMSGIVIKMGIYALVRILSLFDTLPAMFGTVLLLAGIVSSIFGVAFALAQHDLKRLLAYHSIENIGIIVTGLGVGVYGQAHGEPLVAALGYGGALLHVWNHSLFKALLFLSAGAAVHETHTREMDRMGGLGHAMPWTAGAFLTGAVAISGLPPLNGFVSEFLIYIAGFTAMTKPSAGGAMLLVVAVVPALALTGALALGCFVKAFGAVFLGAPRTEQAAKANEPPTIMRVAMGLLAVCCFAIGLFPTLVAPVLARAIPVAAPRLAKSAFLASTLQPVQIGALVVAAAIAIAIALLLRAVRGAATAPTWDCGYAQPTARMQYTSSSLARGLVGFFAWAMPPVVQAPRPFPLFPADAHFESHVPDTVLDRALLPSLGAAGRLLILARHLQGGRVQLYLLYLGVTLIALLAWSAL